MDPAMRVATVAFSSTLLIDYLSSNRVRSRAASDSIDIVAHIIDKIGFIYKNWGWSE